MAIPLKKALTKGQTIYFMFLKTQSEGDSLQLLLKGKNRGLLRLSGFLPLFICCSFWATNDDERPYEGLLNSPIHALKPTHRPATVRSLIAHAQSVQEENDPKELIRLWIERGECALPGNGKDRMKVDLIGVAAKIISIRNRQKIKAEAQTAHPLSSRSEANCLKGSKKNGKSRQKPSK